MAKPIQTTAASDSSRFINDLVLVNANGLGIGRIKSVVEGAVHFKGAGIQGYTVAELESMPLVYGPMTWTMHRGC